MTAPDLVDPQLAAFWASDPSVLTAPDPFTPAPVEIPEHRRRLALEIAAAFLVCARLVRLHLAEQPPPADPGTAAGAAWNAVSTIFTDLTAVSLAESLRHEGNGLEAVATEYADGLGSYLGSSSVASLNDSFYRQVSNKWSDRVSWSRAVAGFGLDARSYSSYLAAAAKSTGGELISPAAQAIADTGLLTRAERIGESEAHTSIGIAQALHWRTLQRIGTVSAGAVRRWVTAHREEDCRICAPMQGVTVPLDEPFIVDGREMWSPQAHPNCQCHVELVEPVVKAYNPHEKREGPGGAHPGRWAQTATQTSFADEVMAQLRAKKKTDEAVETVSPFGEKQASPFGDVSPFGAATASTAFADAAFAAAKGSTAFSGSDAFKTGSRGFQPLNLRVRRSRILVPPPLMPKQSDPYYLPVDDYHAEVNEHDVHQLLGLYTDIDFDLAQPASYGPLKAYTVADPWQSLSYQNVADGRVESKLVSAYVDNSHASVVPKASREEVRTMWDILLPDAVRGWYEAINNVQNIDDPDRGIAADMTPKDRDNIAEMAGFTGYSDDADLTSKIVEATRKLGSGNDSLAHAYADYAVYHRPDLLGELGNDIAAQLEVARTAGIDLTSRPVDQVLVFENGFHPGTRRNADDVDPRGKFIVVGLKYRSAIGDRGYSAQPLNIGVQEAYVQPFVEHPDGFLAPQGARL